MQLSQTGWITGLNIRSRMARLGGFTLLAYALSWAIWMSAAAGGPDTPPLMLIAGFAPTLSGLAFLYFEHGSRGLKDAWASLTRWDIGRRWWLAALGLPPLVMIAGIGYYWAVSGALPRISDPAHIVRSAGQWPLALLVTGWVLAFTALGEEIGWRGYALPRLVSEFGAPRASLMVGAAWGLWHLPLFLIPGNFHQSLPAGWFLLQIMASSVLMTWIYRRTDGSLLAAVLFHTACNASVGLLPVLPADAGGSMAILWFAVLTELAAALIVLRFDPRMR